MLVFNKTYRIIKVQGDCKATIYCNKKRFMELREHYLTGEHKGYDEFSDGLVVYL